MCVLWSSGDSRSGTWDAYVCYLGITLSCHLASFNSSTLWGFHWNQEPAIPPQWLHTNHVDKLGKATRKHPCPGDRHIPLSNVFVFCPTWSQIHPGTLPKYLPVLGTLPLDKGYHKRPHMHMTVSFTWMLIFLAAREGPP